MATRLSWARPPRGASLLWGARLPQSVAPWLAVLAALLMVAACTSPDRPSVQADEVVLPAPMRSFDASVALAIAEVGEALADVRVRLEEPAGAYRPSEPASLMQVPRVVRRADVADRDDGYVVIYEALDATQAAARARELADYLGSGFGQTNYAADTQFSVSVLGVSVIFTTWSSRRSDDPALAEAVFEAVAAVGEPVEIRK